MTSKADLAKKATNTTQPVPTQRSLAPAENSGQVPPSLAPALVQPETVLGKDFFALAEKISAITDAHEEVIRTGANPVVCAMARSRAISCLREVFDETVMIEYVMPLMGVQVGFLADLPSTRDNRTYAVAEVKECVLSALLQGLHLDGNEWNIIKGKCYITVNGWRRKFSEITGISDIRIAPGKPRQFEGQWIVTVRLSWLIDGKPDQLTDNDGKPGQAFVVKGNSDSDAAYLIGKAVGDAYQAAWWKATLSDNTLAMTVVRGEQQALTMNTSEAEKLSEGAQAASTAQAILEKLQRQREAATGEPPTLKATSVGYEPGSAAGPLPATPPATPPAPAPSELALLTTAVRAAIGAIRDELMIDDVEYASILAKLGVVVSAPGMTAEQGQKVLAHLKVALIEDRRTREEKAKGGRE